MKTTFLFKVGWVLLMLADMAACSSQMAYTAGQAWRQNQCNALNNIDDRQRCMKEAGQPYDSYQQDAEKLRSGKTGQ
jgi:hypothetical protein